MNGEARDHCVGKAPAAQSEDLSVTLRANGRSWTQPFTLIIPAPLWGMGGRSRRICWKLKYAAQSHKQQNPVSKKIKGDRRLQMCPMASTYTHMH